MDFDLFKDMFKVICTKWSVESVSISDEDFKKIYEKYIEDCDAGIPGSHAMNAAIYYNTGKE
jgi:hypothetical protein